MVSPPPSPSPQLPPSSSPPPPRQPPPRAGNLPPPRGGGGGGGGVHTKSGGAGGENVISKEGVVGIVILGVALVIFVVSIICVCCCKSKRRRKNNNDYGRGNSNSYYVTTSPLPLPSLTPPQGGHYDVQAQHWQQNYSPPADDYQPPNLPPRPIQRGPSVSSIGTEIMLLSPSPVIPLGFSKSNFSYDELAMATDNFSEANVLGEGDYGCVHKGVLPNGKEIVVKSIKSCNGKRQQEFQAEVEIIGRVHHKHVVYLLGYCITESHWLLVYDFVSNRTMDFHLHKKGQPTIDWPSRLKIAKGSAKGLAYLHEDCHPKIIHGNIKASNILLNHKFEAKVADFGRAKFFADGNTHVSTRVIGALGYLAPEYVATGKLSDKSDVFSFGVVLLELITGHRPSDSSKDLSEGFVDWARPLLIKFLEENNFESLVDPHLQNNYDRNEMARMIVCAAACVRHSARSRPQMSQVVRALDGEMSLSNSNHSLKRETSSTYSTSDPSSDSETRFYKEGKKTLKQVAVTNQDNCSSEYDGTASEYGMYPSGLSSELPSRETTREIKTAKMKGIIMLIHIGPLRLNISPLVLACVAAGALVLLILIICCCWWCCCRRKNDKDRRRNQIFNGEIPTQDRGNQNARPVQQLPQNNNPPRYSPPAPESRQPPRRPPTKPPATPSSTSSTASSPRARSSTSSVVSSQTMFTYQDLVIATNGFSKGNILGEGAFGIVHKGMLPSGKEVAVKSLKSDSNQGDREFQAEIKTVSRVHHRHLVSLVGYCDTGKLKLLVYELVPNKTLEFHLHGKGQPEMDWPTRMKVALGAAKGLAYLHEDCHPGIIHRDIKAANILLDNKFEAKVADFGLAKFYSKLDTHVSTRVVGTLGYMAPEYASSGQLTVKSDVYSFGVLLLELITGRKPFDRTREVIDLVEWAKPLLKTALEEENFNSLVDPLIQYCFKHTEMSRMVYCVATCVRTSARRRPKMSMVVRALEGNMPLTDLSEGIIADISKPYTGDSESEYSGSQYTDNTYKGDSRGFVSGEHDGTTSEYGLYASTSGTEGQTTQEIDTAEMQRVIRSSQRPI